MKKYLKLMRVHHYMKNCLVFLPLIFSQKITVGNILITLLGFFAFSISSSIIYVINDICDIEKDKNHPVKKNRPLASGEISINNAIIFDILLGIILLLSLILMEYLG